MQRQILHPTAICLALVAALLVVGFVQAADATGPVSPSARVALRAFAGSWSGHTRGLTISPKGLGHETIYSGCCDHVITLEFQLSHLQGTRANATARATVVTLHIFDKSVYSASYPAPRLGEVRQIHLKNGVIAEALTRTNYCDDSKQATGVCGA